MNRPTNPDGSRRPYLPGSCTVDDSAHIHRWSFVGPYVRVGPSAVVGLGVYLGWGVRVGAGAHVATGAGVSMFARIDGGVSVGCWARIGMLARVREYVPDRHRVGVFGLGVTR